MQGALAEVSPVEVCRQLGTRAATGTLALSGDRGEAVLVFREGDLVGAHAPSTAAGVQLGERLVRLGRLDRAALDQVLAEQGQEIPPRALGRLLADRGLVAPDVVRLALQEQVLDAMLEVVGWLSGHFEFQAAEPAEDGVLVAMPVDRVLVEVRRRSRERARIGAMVPAPTTVPVPAATPTSTPALPTEAARVLEAVDGTRSVGAIAASLDQGYDDTRREVSRLVLQGIVQVADTQETAPVHEETPLPAMPTTGPGSVALADDGWADRRHDAAATIDEPEPWVGWANGAPATPPQDDTASTPRPSEIAAATPPAPATESYVAPPADGPPAEHVDAPPRSSLDADTRRALFSELHEVGRANPTIGAASTPADPQSAAPATEPAGTADPTAADGPAEIDTPDPAPTAADPLSRSDVSELLRELHALNLDD